MTKRVKEILANVQDKWGWECALAVSVGLEAGDTLRLEAPHKFEEVWGRMGAVALRNLMDESEGSNKS